MNVACGARESALREREAQAFEAVSAAQATLDEARSTLRIARAALASCLRERKPREDELTYAHERCGCGAPMAYWGATEPENWECSLVLLGRIAGEGSVHSEPIPFLGHLRVDHKRRSL